ncbi:MAG: 23S rRNA (guanosine(2251)-2'-O)-methyltransferase RlmB [Azospira oryzae]|nr:MAG: 23S rRNA (guanosine(2251)-2'-O)-methyltransferase RlmB [Azospira oryzae]PZP80703.1 MAG: 23S rRNA (guanosine(2251)-2'-O)-methyltransferase RlmB [Azospira oryzae]
MAQALVYGFHAVLSRLRRDPASVLTLYAEAGRDDRRMRELLAAAETARVRVLRVERARLDGLTGGAVHQGVVAQVLPPSAKASLEEVLEGLTEPPLLLVLDGVQDPHNLGACFRVADAFGVHAIVAPKDRAVGLTPTVLKVASGAAETVPFVTVTNLARTLEVLKARQVWIWGADPGGARLPSELPLEAGAAWVLGAEGRGLRRLTREGCDGLVRIPTRGQVESLNVAVAAGICLYETHMRRASGSGRS